MPEDKVVLARRKRGYGPVFLPLHQHMLEEGDTWLMLASEVAGRDDFEVAGISQGDATPEPFAEAVVSKEPARPTPESFASYIPVHEDEDQEAVPEEHLEEEE